MFVRLLQYLYLHYSLDIKYAITWIQRDLTFKIILDPWRYTG